MTGIKPLSARRSMPDCTSSQSYRRALGLICGLLLAGILYAGLKPFRAPPNQVSWIAGANAVRFGKSATMISSASFPPTPVAGQRTLEFWVKPAAMDDSSTVIAFYNPASPRQFYLHQSESDLEIRIESSNAWLKTPRERVNFDRAFEGAGKDALWDVTSDRSGTAVYRNGSLLAKTPIKPSASEFGGRLVIGNSPIFNDSWEGVFRGLAIYDTALDQARIARHYANWISSGAPKLDRDDRCIALYLFNEHGGSVVHNRIQPGNDLHIPQKYFIVRQTVLDPVWRSFNWSAGFWKDAFINIAGFIPFGCLLCAYFSCLKYRHPVLIAIAAAVIVSLFIELTQTQLPTRDSSMADLIDNTLGAALGAAAHRGKVAKAISRGTYFLIRAVNRDPARTKERPC
ncbi:MAG: VanZ family protein [Terriglobia bacterium]